MRFFAVQGLAVADQRRVGRDRAATYTDAFKAASTGDDGKQYFIPVYNYPWVVLYRKSLFEEKGYTIPTTIDEFKALGDKMKADGLVPIAFGDKDGWPAMGTFDILNLRLNGYDFHIGLMAGTEKWTDPKTKAVFEYWKDLLPYFQEGARRPDLAGRRAGRARREEGRHVLPRHVRGRAGRPSAATSTTSTSSRSRCFGTEFDAEKAIDAPIDGFMMSAKPEEPRRRQGVPRVRRHRPRPRSST